MLTVDIVNAKNQKTGEIDLPGTIFDRPSRTSLLHESVVVWLRNRRAGTVATKGRSLVSGGGRKPWKQKGTGRARSGGSRSPLWVGGGTIHGPQPRDYTVHMPQRKRQEALKSALSLCQRKGRIVVLDQFTLEKPRTAAVQDLVDSLGLTDRKVLLVVDRSSDVLEKSVRNHPRVLLATPEALNPYFVLYHDMVVIVKDAIARLQEVMN
jgi:large subunit ribosomal protein L4